MPVRGSAGCRLHRRCTCTVRATGRLDARRPVASARDDPALHPGRRSRSELRRAAAPHRARAAARSAPASTRRPPRRSPTAPPCVAVRYADGVVMAGDRRATAGNLDRAPGHREGLPGRPPLGRRHRRRGRSGHGDGQALPAPARALREGRRRRRSASRARPTSSRPDGAQQPARRHAGPRRRAAVRRLRPAPRGAAACSSTTSPAAATRRRNFASTGSGSLHAGTVVKLGFREDLSRDDTVDLAINALFDSRRRGLGHRRPRPRPGHLPGRSPRSPPTASTGSPTPSSPSASAP